MSLISSAEVKISEEVHVNERGTMQQVSESSLAKVNLGISATELIATVMRRVQLAQDAGNPRKGLQTGLQHLEQRRLINGEERQSLTRMCDLALIAVGGGKGAPAAVQRLQQMYDTMVLKTSGPTALGIAGALVQHYTSNVGAVAGEKLGQNRAAGFAGALIIGGVIGGALGGVPGVLIGIVGGAVGALTDCSGKN
jgi:hypothetical protein